MNSCIRSTAVALLIASIAGCSQAASSPTKASADEVVENENDGWKPITTDADLSKASLFATEGALFARTAEGFLRADVEARSFVPIDLGAMTEAVDAGNLRSINRAIAIDPRDSNVLYRGSGVLVEKSTNGGASFASVFDGATVEAKWVQQIVVSRADSNVVYAVLGAGQWGAASIPNTWVMRSADAGATWSDVTTPAQGNDRVFYAGDVLHPHPSNVDAFFVGHPSMTAGRDTGKALYVTTDIGQTYTRVPGPIMFYTKTVDGFGAEVYAVHETDPRAQVQKVCVRDEAGADRSCLEGVRFSGFAVDPSSPSTIYLAAGNGIHESTDGGRTFHSTTPPDFPSVSSLAIAGGSVYAATANGLYRFSR